VPAAADVHHPLSWRGISGGSTVHDLAGFAILFLGVLLALFLLVDQVLPFLATWMFGFLAFFVSAAVILRHGRLHPVHLPHLLKPGIAPLMFFLALTLPTLHALVLYLLDYTVLWPAVAACNLLPPLAFTLRAAVRHRREKPRFLREGHDIEETLDVVRAGERALGVEADRLEMVSAMVRVPEPWEAVAGTAAGSTEVPRADVEALLGVIATLRPAYAELGASLSAAFDEVHGGRAPSLPHPALAEARTRLQVLQDQAADASRRAAEVLWDREPD